MSNDETSEEDLLFHRSLSRLKKDCDEEKPSELRAASSRRVVRPCFPLSPSSTAFLVF